MSERLVHIVTIDGQTFAALMEDDSVVDFAIEVEEVDPASLYNDVDLAVNEGDVGLADWLTQELSFGRAATVGAYFQVDV